MDKFSKSKSLYYATLIDFIQNIFSVIKLDVKDFSNKKIKEKNDIFINDLQELENQSAKVYVTFDFFIDLIYLFIVGISLVTVLKGGDALPYLVFFISIIGKISDKISTCSKELEHVVKFWYLKKQLDEIMSKDNVSKKVNKWNKLIVKDGEFSYKERSKKILLPSFEFEKGDKISIVGESGQGKTTILNVLSGIYPLNSGDILIDDKIVSNPKLDVVYISQDVDLFDLSIRDNLTLGKNISDKKIIELFEDAGLMEWYSNLENGLDEMVGEKGVKLSAGQRQRLNIIRGILIDKGVYFFDEPTSNLDKESEEKIVEKITTKLPVTYDNNILLIVLVILIIAIVIVALRVKSLNKKEEK
jgi:ABC-type multidrug transport system fused ATPase/permease subunit